MTEPISSLYAFVLAGGSGTRLWPLSREELPKQFQQIVGENSLLQETVARITSIAGIDALRIVTSAKQENLVKQQARQMAEMKDHQLILEPARRNTAPAIALGLASLLDEGAGEDEVVLVCPSDHVIRDADAFREAVDNAVAVARGGYLVTFGIVPTGPETGFGYLDTVREEGEDFLTVRRFVEKPDRERAGALLEQGGIFWNGGIFCFTIGTMLDALSAHFPEAGEKARQGSEALREHFAELPARSIDYAVMEHAEKVACVPLDAGWSDVGCWDAVYKASTRDYQGNVKHGDAQLFDCENSYVHAGDRLVVGLGLKDMVVVDTQDATMISPRGSCDKMRNVVETFKAQNRRELVEVPESERPWGRYKVLSQGERFKVKHIVIHPGKRLSFQYHFHRSEHWVVVRGTALVQLDDEEQLVHEGKSVFVSKSVRHRLANPGKVPLEIVEIQCGEYLGEDDIVRITDDYRRT